MGLTPAASSGSCLVQAMTGLQMHYVICGLMRSVMLAGPQLRVTGVSFLRTTTFATHQHTYKALK